jgi:transcriptional regulator with XRE-family HTH domain
MAKPIGADRVRMSTDLGTALGAELTRLRTKRGWSQSRLGEIVGYDERYIRQLERGSKSPTLRTLMNVSTAFRISVSSLIRAAERRVLQKTRE